MPFIVPYIRGSMSARQLKETLTSEGVPTWITYRQQKPLALMINWGNKNLDHPRMLNHPRDILPLQNKLTFFQRTGHDERVVPWTTEKAEASKWGNVFVRNSLTGHAGSGITVSNSAAGPLPDAPLYTQRIYPTHEFRVHYGKKPGGEPTVIDFQRKIFRKTPERPEPLNWAVRTYPNGFVYIHPEQRNQVAVDAVLGVMNTYFPEVNFAGVDVLYCEKRNKAWVLEANTAPGIYGRTCLAYSNFIKTCL